MINLLEEDNVRRILNTAKRKFDKIDSIILFTGDYDYNVSLSTLSRNQWDSLVENFIYIPGLVTKETR